MQFDAQIQMVVSTAKVGQVLRKNENGGLDDCMTLSLSGGARSAQLPQHLAVLKITENNQVTVTGWDDKGLGSVVQQQDKFSIQVNANKGFIRNIFELLPQCEPDKGGYLSINLLLVGDITGGVAEGPLIVTSLEYKAVKQLASEEDLMGDTK